MQLSIYIYLKHIIRYKVGIIYNVLWELNFLDFDISENCFTQ